MKSEKEVNHMELVPWRPLRELTSLRREMEDLLKRFWGEAAFHEPFREEWIPAVDISETEDKVIIQAETPGLDAKDLDVSISADVLTIKGEKKKEEEEKDEHHHCMERCYGSFQRSFRLPSNVKTAKIEATFNKGILKITLPKTEKAKKKEIKIKVQ